MISREELNGASRNKWKWIFTKNSIQREIWLTSTRWLGHKWDNELGTLFAVSNWWFLLPLCRSNKSRNEKKERWRNVNRTLKASMIGISLNCCWDTFWDQLLQSCWMTSSWVIDDRILLAKLKPKMFSLSNFIGDWRKFEKWKKSAKITKNDFWLLKI